MSTHQTLSRQWEMLRMLPSRGPGITSKTLCDALLDAGYQVSKRTVERDLQELSRIFPLQCNDAGKPWGWHWRPGEAMGLPGLSLAEALSLTMVEEALPTLLPSNLYKGLEPRFQQARDKLDALAEDNAHARWPRKVATVRPELSLCPPSWEPAILESVQLALLEERQIHCRYYSAHQDKERQLTLNPLALVQRGLVVYLIATSPPHDDARQYALHRFRSVALMETPAQGADSFDLNAYLDSGALQFNTGGQLKLRAWISESLARLLRETPLSEDMRLEPCPDGHHLQATVRDSWQLRWWLLQQGSNICVQAPPELRQYARHTLQAALQRYDENNAPIHGGSSETP